MERARPEPLHLKVRNGESICRVTGLVLGGQATLVVGAGGRLEAAALELDAVRLKVRGAGASVALAGCQLRNNVTDYSVRAPLPLPRHPTLRFG